MPAKHSQQEEILRYVWSDEPDVPADIVVDVYFLPERKARRRPRTGSDRRGEGRTFRAARNGGLGTSGW